MNANMLISHATHVAHLSYERLLPVVAGFSFQLLPDLENLQRSDNGLWPTSHMKVVAGTRWVFPNLVIRAGWPGLGSGLKNTFVLFELLYSLLQIPHILHCLIYTEIG